MGSDQQPGCNISSLKHETVHQQIPELNSTLSSGWKAVKRVHVTPRVPLNGSLSRKSLAYMRACARYLKQVSRVLQKEFVTSHTGPRSLKALQGIFGCIFTGVITVSSSFLNDLSMKFFCFQKRLHVH